MIRRIALAVVVIAIWLCVFGWTAGLPCNAPLVARSTVALEGRNLQSQFGSGAATADAFVVSALGADGTGLQTIALAHLPAQDYPILRYRIDDFPDTLELTLTFRRADDPDDVKAISIAAPVRGETSVDLSSFPEWRGEITELGFAEYTTAQLVPSNLTTFKRFRIENAELQSPSWGAVFSRLRSDWFGYRPWALYSISALGPQIETLQTSWMQPAIVFGALLSLLVAWVILRWSRRRFVQTTIVVAAVAWITLDLRWLDDFLAKHRVIEQLYAGKSWDERQSIQPDPDLYAAARELTQFAAQRNAKRVLVLADSTYPLLRFIYFSLPLNTAPLTLALNAAPAAPLPRDALIAVFGSEAKFDETAGTLTVGSMQLAVTPLLSKGDLRIYRPREATP